MPRSQVITPLVIACAALGACAHRSTSSAELRVEVDRHSCASWEPEVAAWSAHFLDASCPRPPASTPLARAVAAAVDEARSIPFLTDPYEAFYAALEGRPGPPRAAADALVRAAVWRDPRLARAVLDRVLAHLPAQHLRCEDCRPPPPLAARTVPWDAFFPYLLAFVWPVRSEGGQIDIYTCSASNGAAALPPDPALIDAAKLAALAFAEDETTARQIRELARGPVGRSVPDVARDISALLAAPAGRAHACATLARHRWFTGLTVEPC